MNRSAWFLAAMAVVGCGPSVKSVGVEPAQTTLSAKGATRTLRAVLRDVKGKPLDAAKFKVTWTSAAASVASVDESGTVTAIRSGEAQVVAAVGEVRGGAHVTVSIPTTVTVAPAAGELRPGQALVLSAAVLDEFGKPVVGPAPVTWTSSDGAIATVSEGRVIAVGPGTATVTAAFGGVRGTAQVSVKLPEFAKLVVKPAKLHLRRGDTIRLRAEPLDRSGHPVGGVGVTWRSSDGRIATVAADGSVHAMKKGKVKVTATASGKSATVPVVVAK